jgi:hypothetical protein
LPSELTQDESSRLETLKVIWGGWEQCDSVLDARRAMVAARGGDVRDKSVAAALGVNVNLTNITTNGMTLYCAHRARSGCTFKANLVSGGASTSSSDSDDSDDNAGGAADKKALPAKAPKERKENEKVSELRDRLLEARENATLMTPAEMVSAINELSGFPMTVKVLRATKVGKAVKKLCKREAIEVQDAAKELIAKWTKTIENEEKEREEKEQKEEKKALNFVEALAEQNEKKALEEQKEKEQKALEKKALEKKALEKKALEKKALEQKALEEKALEEKALEEKALEEKALEEKALEEKALEEKALAKKALQKKAL